MNSHDRLLRWRTSSILKRFITRGAWACLSIWLFTSTVESMANGQDDASFSLPQIDVDAETARIQSLIESTTANDQIGENDKTRILTALQQAFASLQNIAVNLDSITTNLEAIANSESLTEEAQLAYENTPTEADPTIGLGLSEEELDAELSRTRALLESENLRVEEKESERIRRTNRRQEIDLRLVELNQLIRDADASNQSTTDTTLEALAAAQLERQRWELEAMKIERNSLSVELRRFEEESELLPAQSDLARRKVLLYTDQVQRLESLREFLRKSESEQQQHRARDYAKQFAKHPELELIAREIESYAGRRIDYATRLDDISRDLSQRQQQLTTLDDQFQSLRDRVENIGTTTSIGLALRKQRSQLPSRTDLRNEIRSRQELIRFAELDLYDAADVRDQYANPDRSLKQLAEQTGLSESELRPLLQLRRDVADRLHSDIDDYFNRLVDLNTTTQRLVSVIDENVQFIDRHILWIVSNEPIWRINSSHFGEGASRLFSGDSISKLAEDMTRYAPRQRWLLLMVAIVFAVLFWEQRRMRNRISKIADMARPVTSVEFKPTINALMLTVFVSGMWPLLVAAIGWLAFEGSINRYGNAIGMALLTLAGTAFILEFFRQACREDGLGRIHFKWPARVATRIRSAMRWAIFVMLPITFLHEFARGLDDTAISETWQRLFFVANQIAMVGVSFYLFRPSSGVFREHIENHPGGWIHRLRYAWLAILLGVPVALIGLAIFGYLYTAEELFDRLQSSILWLALLLLCSGLLTRWILVNRRRLRLQQFRDRLDANDEPSDEINFDQLSDVELKSINDQSKRLIRSGLVIVGLLGLYGIWARVLPALSMLDEVRLWSIAQSGTDEVEWITAKSILFLMPLCFGIWVLARNAPGLLEIAILQHLPLDSSIRYAITTLVRYIIVMIGAVATMNMIGMDWTAIRLALAGLGIGLGFGLQEIFANFVSGVILLFERPIRIGDVVTMGDVTGVVTQIKIRATTITNWDRKDFIVPNKDLITGRVLNWTLSDTSNRITINVGVGYNSTPADVRRILLEILHDNPTVVSEPAPMVTLESFDDSSLRFVVRAHIARLSDRLTTIHDLHETIFERFAAEDIEIAFPQLDIHMRSSDSIAASNDAAKSIS